MATGTTNVAGQVIFPELGPGSYRVDVFPPATHEDVADQTVTVAVGQEAQVTFRLAAFPTAGSLRVTVTEQGGQQQVLVGVRVDITPVP